MFASFRLRASALTLALAAILACVLAPGALAAEKGIQTDLSWGTSIQEQERTLAALEGTNVKWIRLDISWRNTERTDGVYDADNIALTDRALALAERAGARVIMVVNESPEWASGSTNPNSPPRDPAHYAAFVRDMAARYAGRVAAWEIWNEPNHPRFWPPAPDAAAYARLLAAAAPAVRAGDPAAKVVFGGIAHNDYPYLERVYAAAPAIGDSFDAMATHPYTAGGQSPANIALTLTGRMTTSSFLAFREVRDVMRAHGDEQPIWLTELGWSTNTQILHPLGGVTEAVQAAHLASAFTLLEAAPYVEVAVVYNLRNNYWAGDADTWEDQLGLLRTDFSPKPAFSVFKNYGPPAPVATPPAPVATPPAPVATPPAAVPTSPAPLDTPSAPAVATRATEDAPADPGLDDAAAQARAAELAWQRSAPTITVALRRLASTAAGADGRSRLRVRVSGRVRKAVRGSVRIVTERRVGSGWKRAQTRTATLRGARFTHTVSLPRGRRWRIRAVYSSANGHRVSARPVSVR